MFRGNADYPDLARIITASARGEGDDRVETPEALASGYDHLERAAIRRATCWSPRSTGVPVGYSRVRWDDESDGRVYKFVCFLDPAYGGRGIGSALLAWNEARLREIAADHDVPVKLLEAWVGDRNEAATELVRAAGYEPVTYMAEMVRPSVDDLPDHPLPDGCRDPAGPRGRHPHDLGGGHGGLPRPLGLRRADARRTTSGSARSRTSTPRSGRSRGTTRGLPAR